MLKFAIFAGAIALSTSAMAAMLAPSTADYIMKAGQSDQFEIQTGKLAEKNGGKASIKHMGAKMVMDHTKSTKLIMAAAQMSHIPVPDAPPALDSEQQSMLSDLQVKTGNAFDAAYLADQATAHQKALELQEAYAMGGSDPNFKAAAKQIVPVVKIHIHMLKSMGA